MEANDWQDFIECTAGRKGGRPRTKAPVTGKKAVPRGKTRLGKPKGRRRNYPR